MVNKSLKHISIIMDGNGRWANNKNMPRAFGHRTGVKSINSIIRACKLRQISELTLFVFSSENWKRPKHEVDFLMKLFKESIDKYILGLHENNVKIKFIGDHKNFSKDLLERMFNAEELTKSNVDMKVNFAINYGGRWDIINAFKKFVSENDSIVNIQKINDKNIEKYLSIDSSNPDLLIRTGGEHRLSNFMLWQHAYTELYFTDCLWPDFDVSELDKAINWFQKRSRKFGALTELNTSLKSDA